MTVVELALAAIAVAVGSLLQGSVGFGAMVVAAPVLILIDTELVPGPSLVAAVVLVTLIAHRERASIELRGVGWVYLGRLPGTVAGGLAVAALSERGLELMFGTLLLLGVGLSALAPPLKRTRSILFGAGTLSGLMATATSVGGPPVALLYQREPGPMIRATLNGFFVLGGVTSLAMLAAVGEFGTRELGLGLAVSPGVVVGFLASHATRTVLDRHTLRPWILAVSAASAVVVLARALA